MYQLQGQLTLKDHHLVIGGVDNGLNGTVPTIFIPLMSSANKADMRSISCQTDTSQRSPVRDKSADSSILDEVPEKEEKMIEDGEETEKDQEKEKSTKKKFERSHSVRESKRSKKKREKEKEEFRRSASVRYAEEKAKAVVKDVNLKTSEMHQEKDKGEIVN